MLIVERWDHISVFNLSTLEFDNALHRLSFCRIFWGNSAKLWVQAGCIVQNWVQIGCNFEIWEKEKSRKSLTYRTLSLALQDGLEPTTPWLTVRCSNQLSYWSRFCLIAGAKVYCFSEITKLFWEKIKETSKLRYFLWVFARYPERIMYFCTRLLCMKYFSCINLWREL